MNIKKLPTQPMVQLNAQIKPKDVNDEIAKEDVNNDIVPSENAQNDVPENAADKLGKESYCAQLGIKFIAKNNISSSAPETENKSSEDAPKTENKSSEDEESQNNVNIRAKSNGRNTTVKNKDKGKNGNWWERHRYYLNSYMKLHYDDWPHCYYKDIELTAVCGLLYGAIRATFG